MESKRKNVYIAIFVVTTIIASCIAVYFAIEVKNAKAPVNIAKVEESMSGEASTNAENKTEVQIKEVEKIVEKGVFVPFDSTKGKIVRENSEDFEYSIGYDSVDGIRAYLKNGDAYLCTHENSTYYDNLQLTVKLPHNTASDEQKKVTGFSKKVVDVLVARIGSYGPNYPVILFLMEDGTVEYLSEESIKTGNLVTAGKIEGLKDIVRIEQGEMEPNFPSEGVSTAIAIDKDGYFYDIVYGCLKK